MSIHGSRKVTKIGRVYFGSKFKGIVHMTGKNLQQECEVDGHISPAVRKQREMNVDAKITASFQSS